VQKGGGGGEPKKKKKKKERNLKGRLEASPAAPRSNPKVTTGKVLRAKDPGKGANSRSRLADGPTKLKKIIKRGGGGKNPKKLKHQRSKKKNE